MCLAKGLTSGYVPMGATLCTDEIYEAPLGSAGARVQRRVQELGVLLRNVHDMLTFSPALILTTEQADEIVELVDQAIGDVSSRL